MSEVFVVGEGGCCTAHGGCEGFAVVCYSCLKTLAVSLDLWTRCFQNGVTEPLPLLLVFFQSLTISTCAASTIFSVCNNLK